MSLIKTAPGWSVECDDCSITQIQIDFRVGFLISGGSNSFSAYFETPFVYRRDGVKHFVVPGRTESLVPILHTFNCVVSGISATKSGYLLLEFSDGTAIEAGPDETFEAWQLSGLGDFLLVCQPRGEVACFFSESTKATSRKQITN